MPDHPLTNFQMQTYYQNRPKFNGAYLRNNLPKIKGEADVINLDEFESTALYGFVLDSFVS